jgi:hypothetical protein
MNDSEGFGFNRPNDPGRRIPNPGEPQPRAVGSPLPTGTGGRSQLPGGEGDSVQYGSVSQPPGRALANQASTPAPASPGDAPASVLWLMNALRGALPFVHKILPLLDGNIGTAVSNILTPHPQPPPPPPPVNLEPLEDGLAELRSQHRDLRNQIVEQNSSLKRVEDHLEMVREATDRNTLEQQELLEDLKSVGNKVNMFALLALVLLAVSIVLNVILFLHIKRVLP